jgi:hypothetical protein
MKINFNNEEIARRSVPFELTHTPALITEENTSMAEKKKEERDTRLQAREGIRSFSFLERGKENEERGKTDPHKSNACVLRWISSRHFFCL